MIHEVLLTNAWLPTECFCVNVYSSWVRSFREARLGSPSTSTGWNREIQRTRRTWKQVSICTSICIFDPTDCLDLEESEDNYNASWSDHFCSQATLWWTSSLVGTHMPSLWTVNTHPWVTVWPFGSNHDVFQGDEGEDRCQERGTGLPRVEAALLHRRGVRHDPRQQRLPWHELLHRTGGLKTLPPTPLLSDCISWGKWSRTGGLLCRLPPLLIHILGSPWNLYKQTPTWAAIKTRPGTGPAPPGWRWRESRHHFLEFGSIEISSPSLHSRCLSEVWSMHQSGFMYF